MEVKALRPSQNANQVITAKSPAVVDRVFISRVATKKAIDADRLLLAAGGGLWLN